MLHAQPPANPPNCVSVACCNGLCSGAVCPKLGSWQWGCGEGLGAGTGGVCPCMKLCCSHRGGSCPGESWHHLQERSLQGGEYPVGSHLRTVCAAWPEASQVWCGDLFPSCHQVQGRVLGGWELAVSIGSVCSCSSHTWSGCLCCLSAMFLQEASRFLDWWYICISLLLIACNET